MLRRLISGLVLLAVAGALAWALWPRPLAVETAVVERRDIEVTVEEEGKTRIRDVFSVSAPIPGQVLRVTLHPGDVVVKDITIVASIRPAAPGLLDARLEARGGGSGRIGAGIGRSRRSRSAAGRGAAGVSPERTGARRNIGEARYDLGSRL